MLDSALVRSSAPGDRQDGARSDEARLSSMSLAKDDSLEHDAATRCMKHHESGNGSRVLAWQLQRSEALCKAHGWQGSCSPPCTAVSITADATIKAPCRDVLRPPHPEMSPQNTAQLLARASRAAAGGGGHTARRHFWEGKVLRVRSFVNDGFWVRAHMVLTQGLWASLRGLPFFVHLHDQASCGDIETTCAAELAQSKATCLSKRTCDAYSSSSTLEAGWEEYFEPVGARSAREVYQTTPLHRILQLTCPAVRMLQTKPRATVRRRAN